jgi:hypothetical protein
MFSARLSLICDEDNSRQYVQHMHVDSHKTTAVSRLLRVRYIVNLLTDSDDEDAVECSGSDSGS